MIDKRTCPKCGVELHEDEFAGLCVPCGLQQALQPVGATEEPPCENRTIRDNTGLTVGENIGDTIGHYKLREKIGEGGGGEVYVADQEQPVRRRVALKIIKLGMATRDVVARFEAERQALAMMDHPNIAKVFDAGATATGRPFFVMELVRGIKITDYCDQKKLSTEERLRLFIQVCQAVQHAHQKGIIHRDIKPSNILVTLHDGVPVPKVIDFGIAKAVSNQRLTDKTVYTAFNQFLGTPAYMSPEQAEMSGLDIDTRSDIYSLGVLLYELLTGRTPFDAKTLLQAGLDQMRKIIREQEPPRPSTRLSTLTAADLTSVASQRHAEPPKLISLVRGDLDWIVMRALEKDRARRYEAANGLAADVQRYLNCEPVVASPPSTTYRFQKMLRRNKVIAGFVAALSLTLVCGMMGILWQWRKAEFHRRIATQAAEKAAQQSRRANEERDKALAARRTSEELVRHLVLSRNGQLSPNVAASSSSGLLFDFVQDQEIQAILDSQLELVWKDYSPKAAIGIVVNPKSGDILAQVSKAALDHGEGNPALGNVYEPGRMISFVVLAAALEHHLVEMDSKIDCENGNFEFGGRKFHDSQPQGVISVREVQTRESGIGLAKLGILLGNEKLEESLRGFGFGTATGILLANEAKGIVVPSQKWGDTFKVNICMGSGVGITPLQMTMAMAALANDGTMMSPRVLRRMSKTAGQEILSVPPQAVGQVVSQTTARLVRDALGEVAGERGLAPLAAVRGFKVGGVSATSQKAVDGKYSSDHIVAAFLGFLPAEDPAFVCLILIDDPKVEPAKARASLLAAPVFSRVASQIAATMHLKQSSFPGR